MQEINTNHIDSFDDELDIKELFLALLKRIKLIFLITTASAILSVVYALSLPNMYTSNALLAVANEKSSLSSQLGSYSALAGMAGVSLPSSGNNKSTEAVARIKSFNFFSNHFLPFINLEDLFAVSKWVPEGNYLLYDDKLFNKSKEKWVRNTSPIVPSNQEAYEIYQKILSISENKKTLFVSLSIEHHSPHIAKEWVDIIIKNINESMRSANMEISSNSINFLKERSQTTNFKEIRDAITQLLQSQMQSLMLASVSESYVYKILNSPIAPEKKSSPGRALICFFGTLIGLLAAMFLAMLMHFREKN
tara:strand:+ start:137 stop:1057 length:921 start_codon:yes stop_codon:yes gene_type:complete